MDDDVVVIRALALTLATVAFATDKAPEGVNVYGLADQFAHYIETGEHGS
jgi:hypothetical protein